MANEHEIPDSPPPTPDSPDSGADPARRYTRRVVLVSGVLTALVLGCVVALAVVANSREADVPSWLRWLRPLVFSPEPGAPRAEAGTSPGPRDYPFVTGDPRARTEWDDPECAPDAENPPELRFDLDPQGLDFGQVKQGVRIEREVSFTNGGPGVLCIRDVSSGCGCIKARLADATRRFAPGQGGRIVVALDSTGREGLQTKGVRIFTNHPTNPMQQFTVRANITLGLVATPTFLNFGRVASGRPAQVTLRLRSSREEAPWEVLDVKGTRPFGGEVVTYEWEVVERDDPRFLVREIVITHPGITTAGAPFQDLIQVSTSHPDRPQIEVRAHMTIVDAVYAVPPRAALGFVKPGDSRSMRIQVHAAHPGDAFRITEVVFAEEAEGAGTGFVARPYEDENGIWWVEVSYDGRPREPGYLHAVLLVRTDHEAMPEVRVDCFATVEAED